MLEFNRLTQNHPATDHQRRVAAWYNAFPIPERPDWLWRWDCDGRVIHWSDYGRLTSHGWEIDHIVPVALGGSDDPSNLRARHWEGNRSSGGALARILRRID